MLATTRKVQNAAMIFVVGALLVGLTGVSVKPTRAANPLC